MAPLNRRSLLAGGAAAAAAGIARPALAFDDTIPLGGLVTIAVVAPFTGDAIRLGEQIGNGVRAAVDDANLVRGQLDKAFAIRTFDDQNLVATGIQNAEFACGDSGVACVIGHLSGRVTEAAMPTYATNKMPVICPAASYDRLTERGFSTLLRLATKDSSEGRLAASFIAASPAKPASVVALYQDGDYGADVVRGLAEELGGDKIPCTPVMFGIEKPDYAAAAAQALAAKPGAIFLAGTTHDMGPVVPQLRSAGYAGPFYASQGFFEGSTIATYGAQLEGLVIASSMPPLAIAPSAYRIKGDFERKYGALTPLSAFGYAAAQIVIAVVHRTNALDRLAIARAFDSAGTYATLVGTLRFGTDGDPQDPQVYFYAIKDGAWRYVASAHPSDFIVS